MNPIGILQGRLSPRRAAGVQSFPWKQWRQEFADARACGFQCLEWLVTAERLDDNPIWREDVLGETTGVAVTSLCADCFIDQPFVRVSEDVRQTSVDTLERLVVRCGELGIAVLLLPVLEQAAIRDPREAAVLLDSLRGPLRTAASMGVVIALESDWVGAELRALIDRAGSLQLGAYYDVGNATAMGHDPAADVRALGPVLAGVHLKDRHRGGGSVPLGDGDVDFPALFHALSTIHYTGPMILETPVGDDPLTSARHNRAFLGVTAT